MSSESRQASSGDRGKNESPPETSGSSKEKDFSSTRLPFEPAANRKKTQKKLDPPKKSKPTNPKARVGKGEEVSKVESSNKAFAGIPETVSKRMARRMALFSGIPTGLGMLTFIVSYIVVTQQIFKLPTVAVLLVSLGFFGLGVLGLSYGVLSASWDEDRSGSWLGWSDFRTNFGRTIDSWRNARQKVS